MQERQAGEPRRVALIGDSVATSFHVSSVGPTIWRALRCGSNNWFVDLTPGGIRSVWQRLNQFAPFQAIHRARPGAMVVRPNERVDVFRRLLGTEHFSGQVRRIVSLRPMPDLILISIGHNNVDWTWRCAPGELPDSQRRLRRLADEFADNFRGELRRLIGNAQAQEQPIAIVVFGVINFASYFEARALAEERRQADATLYPHLETTYRYYRSFRPELRHNLIRLATMLNDELRQLVRREATTVSPNVQLRYSDALATVDLSSIEFLHATDGWHPSSAGHQALADAAFADLGPSLQFLGLR